MDFAYSEKVNKLRQQLNDFMDRYIYPNEQTYREQIAASGNPHHHAEIVDELKAKARAERLVHTNVVNRAMQVFGGAGLSDDFPLALMWAHGRTLHLADGPDEVHKQALAKSVIRELTK